MVFNDFKSHTINIVFPLFLSLEKSNTKLMTTLNNLR